MEHQILINDTEATRQTLVSRRLCFDAAVMNLLSPFRLSLDENKKPQNDKTLLFILSQILKKSGGWSVQ